MKLYRMILFAGKNHASVQKMKFHLPALLLLFFYCLPSGLVKAAGVSKIDSLTTVLQSAKSPKQRIEILYELSKAYNAKSELENALKTEKELLEVISEHGTKLDSAKCFRMFGLTYMQKAVYEKSLENFMRAQRLFGQAGDSSSLATTIMNTGTVHDYMGNFPMSLAYYEKALKYFIAKKENTGIAGCKLNIAIILTKQKQYQKATENLISAAEIYKKTGNNAYLAAANINLGLTYKKMGNYDLAIEYIDKAMAYWTEQQDEYHICYYHLNMGEIMLDMKRTSAARDYLIEAEKLARKAGAKDLQVRAYEFLADFYAASNDYKSAFTYMNKCKLLGDSLLNAETTEKVNQIQYQYEIARREADNEHLVKENLNKELQISKKNLTLYILSGVLTLIAVLVILLVNQNRIKRRANELLEIKNNLIVSQKDELITLNASKDKFLSILAHDIKNPLSSIYGISDLLVNDYDKLTSDEKRIFTQDIHTLSNNLFEIINTLLTWSTSQSGLITYRPKNFNIAAVAEKTIHNLQTVAKQKDLRLVSEVQNPVTVYADENMVYSILHNLINNAIKFSYPGTAIRIESKMMEEFVEISVIDRGIGLSAESQAKIFRYDQHFLSKGTAGESGTGLGLILCKDFVDKNGGSIRVESEIDNGSAFIFTIPLNKPEQAKV